MMMGVSEHIDLDVKGLSLLDDSPENDDFVLSLSPSPLKQTDNQKDISLEMSGTMDAQEGKDIDNKGEEDDMLPELHVSKEPERSRRKGKLNLRKSLAWDSAFFTDAGVLDAEELSSMVKGAEKIEKNIMPRIDEDVERSTDTISTFASDNVTLEHLEADLFEDIRASIQRSNKVSKVMTPAREEVSSVADNGANSASKKADATLKNVPKPKLAPKKAIGVQNLGMLKSQQKHTDGIQGSRKAIKQENPRVPQSVIKSGDSTSSLAKLPKLPSKVNPIPTTMAKRASLSANHAKNDHDNTKTNAVAGKGAQTSKVFDSSNNTCKALPKPALSSKSSLMRFSAASKMQSSRSSSDSTGSTVSDKAGKPTLPMARRKLVNKPVSQPSSGSILKTPSKAAALKNKVSSGNSAISAYLMSSKINSSISPASSISEWSSASASSSSSCSIINERSNKLRISFDTSSCRSVESDASTLDFTNSSSNQIPEKLNQGTASPQENTSKASTQSDRFPRPPMKPSGLRMPSPKIGFFDGTVQAKSVRTPSKQSTALPKIGTTICSPNGRSNMKSKASNLPPSRMSNDSVNVKSGTQNLSSPVSLQDKSPTSLNITDAPIDKQCFPTFAPEVHHEANEESNSYAMDVGSGVPDTVKHVVEDAGFDAVNHGDLGVLKNEMTANVNENANSNDIKVEANEESNSFAMGVGSGVPDTIKHVVEDAGFDAVNHGDHGVLKNEMTANVNENANSNDIKVEANEESNSFAMGVGSGVPDTIKHVVEDAGFDAVNHGDHGVLKNEMAADVNENANSNDIKVEANEESNSFAMGVGSGVPDTIKHVVEDAGFDAVNHGDHGVLKNEMAADVNENANSNDIKVVAVEEESFNSISKNTDTTTSELAASRTPFAVKNSENGDFLDFSKDLVVEVAGKINSAIPLEIDYKENNNL